MSASHRAKKGCQCDWCVEDRKKRRHYGPAGVNNFLVQATAVIISDDGSTTKDIAELIIREALETDYIKLRKLRVTRCR